VAPPDPGKPPKKPGDPPVEPGPQKVNPGDTPPKNPGDTPPKKPGAEVADPGNPPKKPKEPTAPEKPDSVKDGDWVQANIDAVGAKKKNVAKMTDADIDNLDLTSKQKQDMKDIRAKKQKDLDNIKTQKKKYGPDADVKNLERDIVKYDKQSFDLQNKSQLNEVGKQRKIKAQYDTDVASYNKKKANFDSKSKHYDADINNYQKKKGDFDNYKKQKTDMDNYSKQKTDFDNYQKKKADFDSYSKKKTDFDSYQNQKADIDNYNKKKADFDGYNQKKKAHDQYSADMDSYKKKSAKHDADIDSYKQKKQKYDNDMADYQKKHDSWQENQNVAKTKNQEYKAANQKYDADMDLYKKDSAQYQKDYKKYELDGDNYKRKAADFDADTRAYNKQKGDFDNYQKQKSDFDNYQKQKGDFDSHTQKKQASNDYKSDMDNWTEQKNKYELDNTSYKQKQRDYDASMNQHNKDYDSWQSNKKVSESKNADFQASQKKYDSDLDTYNKDMDSYNQKKQQYDQDMADNKTKRDQFDKDMEDYHQKQRDNDYKQEKYERDVKDWEDQQVAAKKKADADAEAAKKKADADAEAAKKKADADAEAAKKKAEEPEAEKPKDEPDAEKPEEEKSAWDKVKEGGTKAWDGFKKYVLPGAKLGTRVTESVKRYSKDGKKVDYCDPETEKGCKVTEKAESKRYEFKGKEVDFCDPQKEADCRVIMIPQNPESNINRKKQLDFSDPNKLLETFFNHDFKKSGLTHIEDALMLDKEWKGVVRGDRKSPSLIEYKQMQDSGIFGKNPEMANLLYNMLVVTRSFSKKLYETAFPVVQAQTTTPPAIDSKPPNTWEEETDDDEDADNKKKRQQEKGKQAGMMIGMAAGGMLAGLAFEQVLDRMGPMVQKVRVFFGTSPGIAILAGMGTLINGLTLGFVVEEKKAFQENLKKIDDIKGKFESDMAEFCPKKDDRENQGKPNCYCYSFGGKRNPLRNNSNICKSYWARFDAGFYVGAGKYEYMGEKNIKGCVDMKGNYDFKCNCRRYKNRDTGQNACYKTKTSFDGLGNIGTSSSTGVLTGYGNAVAQDPATLHSLNGDAISRSAVKLKNAGDKALKGYNLQRAKEGKRPLSIGANEVEKFVNKVMAMPGSRGAMAALSEAKTTPARPPMKASKDLGLKDVQKKLDLDKIKYESTKKKAAKKEKEEKKVPEWDFAMGEEEKALDKLEFMDKKYDYKKGVKRKEITDKKGASIFKLISNRYINTGLKLLFEDD